MPRLPPSIHLDRLIDLALEEDLFLGDVTTAAVAGANERASGRFVARSDAVLAGSEAAERVFQRVDPEAQVRFLFADGELLAAGTVFGEADGKAAALLMAERTALNLLQRLCGIATLTRRYVEAVRGTAATIIDTRKTTPGLRALEKAAVVAGGGKNHRSSLGDGVLIKTNHVRIAGSVEEAVKRSRAHAPHTLRIEVEVRDLEELGAALQAKADVCLLDNMGLDALAQAVKFNRDRRSGAMIEASGGVTLETVRAIAETGVDLISVGRLTHSAPAADLAFEVGPAEPGR